MNDEFLLTIIAMLNKQLSKRRLKSDLKTLDDSMYVKVIAKLSRALSKRQLKNDLKQLNDLYIKIGADLKVDKKLKSQLQSRIKELQKSISEIEIGTKVKKTKLAAEVDSVRKEAQKRAGKTPVSVDINIKKNKAIADIEYLGKRFSKLFSDASAKQKYNNLLASAHTISDESQLRSVRAQISAFTSELKANDLASKSLGDKWKELINRSKGLLSAAGMVTTIFMQIRKAVTTTIELDTAMTNLYKVQDQITSRDQFSGLLTKWNKLAQNLSVTTKSLIDSSASWSKIGFDLDMSEQLAQITAIFEKTAEISNEKANATLISAAQAFTEIGNLGEDDYVERVQAIGDRINKVGNEFAIDSEGISDALQNSSAALRMANNDLDESIAIVTAANKIFQSPDEVGNMAKILSARLRGQRGELEALNEDTDGMIESVNKIQTQILNLTHNKVNIFEADNETLKSTYDIILEIGRVYDSLSDKDQANLLEIMAGKQRMSAVASLLMNYKELEKIKSASINSDNSMQQEYDRYLESAGAHIVTFKEKLVETYSAFMGGDLIKYAADTGSTILDLVNSTDLLRHGILAVLALNFGKGISAIGAGVAGAVKQMNTLGASLQQINTLPLSSSLRNSALDRIGTATQSLTDRNLKLLLSQGQLNESDRIRILSMHGLTEEEALAKLEIMGLTAATNAQTAANTGETASTFTLSGAMNTLKASAMGMWTALKASFAANPIGMTLMLVTTAVSIFSTVMSKHSQKMEEAKQKSIELADKASEESQKISELLTKYNNLTEEVKTNGDAKDELLSTQNDLLESLGIEQSEIDKLIEKYGSLSEAVNRVAVDKLQEKRSDLLAGYNAKKNDVLDIGRDYEHWYSAGNRNMIDASGNDAVKAFKALEKAGIVNKGSFGSGGGSLLLMGDDSAIEGILENYQKLIDAENALNEAFSGEELSSNPLFVEINARKQEMQEAVESYRSSVDEINKNEASIQIFKSLSGKELPKTEEAFESFKKQMIDTAKGSKAFIGSQEDIEDSVINALSSMSEFSQFFDNIAKEEQKASGKVNASFKQIWESLDKDIKNNILELAQAGALTVEKFSGMEGTEKLLEKTGLSAEKLTQKINKLVSSADQLSSMKSGISSISDILGEKKEKLSDKKTKNTGIGIDTLGSMPEEVKSCTKAYENFCEVLGNGASTMSDCQEAANKLATAYVNSNNFLAQLTENNKDYYISVLNEMGVQNAEQIVLDTLNKKKVEAIIQTIDFTNKTGEEIVKLLEEQGALNGTTKALELFALKKIYANGNGLNTTNDINQLIALVKSLGYSTAAIDAYNQARNSAFKPASSKQDAFNNVTDILNGKKPASSLIKDKMDYTEQAKSSTSSYIENLIKQMENTKVSTKVNPAASSSSSSKSPSSKSSANSAAKESTQVIDWIKRKLDVLQQKIDLTKAKFDNLFTVKKQKNNLNNQIKQTTKLLNTQQKAVKKYQKKANSIKLSSSLKKKVQNGAIKGSLSSLIHTYGESTASKITAYQDYIDKIKELKKEAQETTTAVRELKEERNQIYVDQADSKLSMLDAQAEVAKNSKGEKSASAVNKLLQKKVEWTKQYYNYQIKNAKLEKDSTKAAELRAQKEKALLDIQIQKNQNLADEAEGKMSMYDAQAEVARDSDGNKSAKATNEILKKKADWTKKYYNYQIKNAKLEKDTAKEAELRAQKEKALLDIDIERKQNRADEVQASYNLNQQYEANAASAKEKNKYEAKSLKNLETEYKYLIEIAKLEGDATEQKRLQAELEEKRAESYKKMYDNIKTEYENNNGLNDTHISVIQAQIATLEAAGRTATKEMYNNMMKITSDTKKKLLEERAKLEESGKDFTYGSQDWYDWQNDLLSIDQQIESCTQNTIEWQKALNELDLKKFSLIAGQLDATKSHLDFLVDMLSHKDLVSKEAGGFTDEGIATISLRFSNMDNTKKIIANAQKELNALYEKHANGSDFLSETEFLNKREELLEVIRNSTEALADEKDAIFDLVENAIQVQIDAVNELIEKKKKALSEEKNLYEYQKRVAKQTKNIAAIQKQIAALSGDGSEEARARLQKLNVELEEAQQDLKDTEYDKWISDQEDMLDELSDEMEDFLEGIMNDLRSDINGGMDRIMQAIENYPEAVTKALDELGLGNVLSVITEYNKDGTHTNNWIDYGGNSFDSTYDEYGNPEKFTEPDGNVVNINYSTKDDTPQTSIGEPPLPPSSSTGTVDPLKMLEFFQNVNDEIASGAVKQSNDILLNLAKDYFSGNINSDDPMASSGGKHSESINAENRKKIDELMKSSALHKPKTDKGKERMNTDPLLKYIAEKHNGKTLSIANEIKLGAYLGVPVKNTDKVTTAEAKKILDAFKNAGFSEGGVVSTINKAVKMNGDDGIATVKKGEAILTPRQTEAVQDMTERFVKVGSRLTAEQEEYIKQNIIFAHATTDMMDSMTKATQTMETNNNNVQTTNVDVGGITVNLEGSNVVDMDSMFQQLQQPRNKQRMTECVLGQVTNPLGNVLSRF